MDFLAGTSIQEWLHVYLNKYEIDITNSFPIMSPPGRVGRHIVFPVCLSVCPSVRHKIMSALQFDEKKFNETSYICKALSDDVSCTRTITFACIFPPLLLSVGLSVTKSCSLYNLITVKDISTKLHAFIKHNQTTYAYLACLFFKLSPL